MPSLNDYLTQFYHWLLPFHCLLCRSIIHNAQYDLCTPCYHDLPKLHNRCIICGGPLAAKLQIPESTTCALCIAEPPYFHKLHSLFHNVHPITAMLQHVSPSRAAVYLKVFGSLLATILPSLYHDHEWPDLLLPYPSDLSTLRKYGYHPQLELARILGRHLSIDIAAIDISKPRGAVKQLGLYDKNIALIDISTNTGARCNNFSKILLQDGKAQRIDVWCIART